MVRRLASASLAFLVAGLVATPSIADPVFEVMGAHTDNPEVLMPIMDVAPGSQFDVVVLLNSEDSPSAAAEFVLTELHLVLPGVFRLATETPAGTPIHLSIDPPGEYILAFRGCQPASSDFELLRASYGAFGAAIPPDTVIELRGLLPGDSVVSSFGGHPGIADCEDNRFAGRMGGHPGGYSDSGVVFPDGSLALNMTMPVVPAETHSWSSLKSRY